MIVYDVVHQIEPGCSTSDLPGRWLVQHFDRERDARAYCDHCNQARLVAGHRFAVEEHEELSADRAPDLADYWRGQMHLNKTEFHDSAAWALEEAKAVIAQENEEGVLRGCLRKLYCESIYLISIWKVPSATILYTFKIHNAIDGSFYVSSKHHLLSIKACEAAVTTWIESQVNERDWLSYGAWYNEGQWELTTVRRIHFDHINQLYQGNIFWFPPLEPKDLLAVRSLLFARMRSANIKPV